MACERYRDLSRGEIPWRRSRRRVASAGPAAS